MSRYEISSPELAALAAPPADGAAYFELGCLYSSGQGVAVDMVVAHKWFNIAALRGYPEGAIRRTELSFEMTDAEIGAALREARLWLIRH